MNSEVFFYGLFMDEKLLRDKGLNPRNPRKASLPGYGLRIAERATLLSSPEETSYGIVMQMAQADLKKLYSEESVSDYIPEKVSVITETGQVIEAECYNLHATLIKGSNKAYADSLLQLAKRIGLPDHYLLHIQGFMNPDS